MEKPFVKRPPKWRQVFLLGVLSLWFVRLDGYVVLKQTKDHDYLQSQGDRRYLHEVKVVPERGAIFDRNNQVLTVSTPVESLVADPRLFCLDDKGWAEMAAVIRIDLEKLANRCDRYRRSEFMYVARRLAPSVAKQVLDLGIPGLELRQEYKRFYPGGEVGSHLVGFTDVDSRGQEGLERLYDRALSGSAGRKRVLKSLSGHHVESVESIAQVAHGQNLTISIDQRLQSMASEYLKQAVTESKGVSGSVVVVAVPSGEILTMVNYPQFNPNNRSSLSSEWIRNRAVTDAVEPGSTVKPFTVAMALDSGEVGVETRVDTAPGKFRVGGRTIEDTKNHGEISLFDVVVRSSNIGSAKLLLSFPEGVMFDVLDKVGFGHKPLGLPGEAAGNLQPRSRPIDRATLSYGYGFSASILQLARAYTTFATDGFLLPLTIEKKPQGYVAQGERIFSGSTVSSIRAMLEQAASPEGTGQRAQVPRYRIGGKTGTVHKYINQAYAEDRYISLFAGIAPISNPGYVVVVMIDDPREEEYYGGDVAAPVFARLTEDMLRLYNIEPDHPDYLTVQAGESEVSSGDRI